MSVEQERKHKQKPLNFLVPQEQLSIPALDAEPAVPVGTGMQERAPSHSNSISKALHFSLKSRD